VLGSFTAFAQTVLHNPRVLHEVKHDVSAPVRELALHAPPPAPGMIEMREHRAPKHFFGSTSGFDPVVQEEFLPQVSTTNILNFDGITGAQGGAVPPDTNGAVGGTQFVEVTNFDYAVYNKTSGKLLLSPTRMNVIFSGFGGLCESTNGGDPVVLWDKLANRWLITQLAYNGGFTSNFLCVAVSKTADATGSFNRYAFDFGDTLPDYPKYSVWPDAYYVAMNAFGFGFGQPCALDRNAMLAGNSASMVCFTPNSRDQSFLPSDLDGSTLPPAGAPNHYVELGNDTSTLNEFDFHVDFANPQNSTFTGPHVIKIPTYSLINSVPQPPPGAFLDSLGDRLMFRLAYRNFGDHEAMVVAHSVRPGGNSQAVAATRWYELRATPPGKPFHGFQGGTVQTKTINLWMGSVAMDKMGNIALGMSADNATNVKPSIWYTGRNPSDPKGKMQTPTVVVKGGAVQTGTDRWGDYSSMSIDPSDDCTFWYTTEYYNAKSGNGDNWTSHMVSFKFNNCN
jgi:hypothetical protein